MTRPWELLASFGRFWWGFVVGDDWTTAGGVLAALAGTYGLVQAGARPAWLLLPLASATLVALGVRRADRRGQGPTRNEGSKTDSGGSAGT